MHKNNKELLFSLTKKDFKVEFIRGSGPGGQHRNKVSTGCRITHPDSGAVGQATDSKSQVQNKKKAFERLVNSSKFKSWHKIEVSKRTGELAAIEQEVDRSMRPSNLSVHVKYNGKWVEE